MIYTIENDKIKASFSDVGAELVSLINKADGEEYLWQGDAAYWTGHAYNLFPICGEFSQELLAEKLLGEKADFIELEETMPNRPPVLCPGCPHRGMF